MKIIESPPKWLLFLSRYRNLVRRIYESLGLVIFFSLRASRTAPWVKQLGRTRYALYSERRQNCNGS